MAAETVTRSWVQKTPGVCGGDACIRNTRVTVHGLVEWRQLGLTDEQIRSNLPDLTQADLDAAWGYYARNRDEIEKTIQDDREA